MKVIKENVSNKLEINKSLFYTDLIKVYSKEEVIQNLSIIKDKYKDATHYCYAYIIDDIKKSSDDGEPGGTAGVPIMESLNNKDLNYILCVVTRYFGGIKLGAGGLIRAYTKSLTEALKDKELVDLVKASIIELEFDYDKLKNIDNTINSTNSKLLDKSFDKVIKYKILVSNDNLDKFSNYNKIKDTITYI